MGEGAGKGGRELLLLLLHSFNFHMNVALNINPFFKWGQNKFLIVFFIELSEVREAEVDCTENFFNLLILLLYHLNGNQLRWLCNIILSLLIFVENSFYL